MLEARREAGVGRSSDDEQDSHGGRTVPLFSHCRLKASARAPAPLVPTALVEDIKSTSADIEFMDYVDTGQVIRLEPQDVLVLSYLKSCEHETITGGTVRVGTDKSDVEGGKIARTKVPCNGGTMKLSAQQANTSGASSFRLQNASFDPTVYALPPVIQIPKLRADDSRTLTIERSGKPNERFTVEVDETLINGGFYDLAKKRQAPQARRGLHRDARPPQNDVQGGRQGQDREDAGGQPAAAVSPRLISFARVSHSHELGWCAPASERGRGWGGGRRVDAKSERSRPPSISDTFDMHAPAAQAPGRVMGIGWERCAQADPHPDPPLSGQGYRI